MHDKGGKVLDSINCVNIAVDKVHKQTCHKVTILRVFHQRNQSAECRLHLFIRATGREQIADADTKIVVSANLRAFILFFAAFHFQRLGNLLGIAQNEFGLHNRFFRAFRLIEIPAPQVFLVSVREFERYPLSGASGTTAAILFLVIRIRHACAPLSSYSDAISPQFPQTIGRG